MNGDRDNKPTGKDNRSVNLFALRAAVAAYLCYLGFDIFRSYLVGASTLSPTLAWLCGPGFIAAGLGFGIYSFLRYRREKAEAEKRQEETGKTPDEE